MKAIESIKKITKAMKVVAASKIKAEAVILGKNFALGSAQKVLENESYVMRRKQLK